MIRLLLSSRPALLAEILFLRKQLALFQERKARPRRTTPTFRLAMVALARFFDWRGALVIVKPASFIKWHRHAFRQFWRWKSRRRGRSPCRQTCAKSFADSRGRIQLGEKSASPTNCLLNSGSECRREPSENTWAL